MNIQCNICHKNIFITELPDDFWSNLSFKKIRYHKNPGLIFFNKENVPQSICNDCLQKANISDLTSSNKPEENKKTYKNFISSKSHKPILKITPVNDFNEPDFSEYDEDFSDFYFNDEPKIETKQEQKSKLHIKNFRHVTGNSIEKYDTYEKANNLTQEKNIKRLTMKRNGIAIKTIPVNTGKDITKEIIQYLLDTQSQELKNIAPKWISNTTQKKNDIKISSKNKKETVFISHASSQSCSNAISYMARLIKNINQNLSKNNQIQIQLICEDK